MIEIDFGNYKWLKLDECSNEILVLSKDVLENRPYNENFDSVNWESCTLRKYLNGEFLQRFTEEQKAKISKKSIINSGNHWFGTEGGDNTNDRIFLLSIEEVVKYFGDSGQLENRNPENRNWIDDQYNSKRIATDINNKSCLRWHLRSPGKNNYHFSYVAGKGKIHMSGYNVHYDNFGVRPAMWLKL